MSLKIRLARGGSKKRPYYQIVVADARSPRDGRFLEKLGAWNPMLGKDDANRVQIDADRAKVAAFAQDHCDVQLDATLGGGPADSTTTTTAPDTVITAPGATTSSTPADGTSTTGG